MTRLAIDSLVMAYAETTGGRPPVVSVPRLAVYAGSLVTLAGPSGSGKSTLLYLLAGILSPTRGTIAWDGVDLAGLGEAARDLWRLRHIGFLFQDFHLLDELTALDNVVLPAFFTRWSAAKERTRARALLETFGVPDEGRPVATLSRGERQRVGLARALLFDPPVVLADEPTASLDSGAAAAVTAALVRLAAEGRTVVVATHDRDVIDAADRRLAIEHGILVDAGARR
jgi:putative ABC transport system ATP-binding protein